MKRSGFRIFCMGMVSAFLALTSNYAYCDTIVVKADGTGDYATIQDAIDNATDGDTVLVAAGTYYESIRMANGVTLQGAGADVTTINGGENGHVIVFNLASGTISGFTITNSGNDPGYSAGIFASQCTITVTNNTIINNHYGVTLSSNSNGIIAGNKITNNTGSAAIKVSHSNATITNNIITNNWKGIYCSNSSPYITNNTITNNGSYGILCNPTSIQVIANNIITSNKYGIFALGGIVSPVPFLQISYNNVGDNSQGNYWEEYGIIDIGGGGWIISQPFTPIPRTGEIHESPQFVGQNDGDYHLKSEGWRWDPIAEIWTWDNVTSLCIDAGNPGCDPADEWPFEGNRINMGAYGGTDQASVPPHNWANIADINNDRIVNWGDFGVFASYWLAQGQCIPADLDRSKIVNWGDFAIFAANWLWAY